MRLVDADALIKNLDDAIQDAIRKDEICDYWEDDRSNLLYYLDKAPTVDAVEVVRGEWKRKIVDDGFNADWVCSECGYRVKTDFVNYSYCPNCGARMEGADDE